MGFFLKNGAGIAECGSRFWLELGYTLEELSGDNWIDWVHPDDREAVREFVQRLYDRKIDHGRIVYRIKDREGTWRWCMSSATVDSSSRSEDALYIGHDQEITYIKQLQQQADDARKLAESRAREAEILRYAGAIITASLNLREMVTRVVDQLRRLLPVEHCIVFERQGRTLDSLFVEDDEGATPVAFFRDGPGFRQVVACLRSGLPRVFRDPQCARRYWLAVPIMIHGESKGAYVVSRADGIVFSKQDTRKALAIADFLAIALNNGRMYEKMAQLATIDELTGLQNRRAFFLGAQQALHGSCASGEPFACILADIDLFKAINDEYGHPVGDEVIEKVAQYMRRTLRDADILGRFGGEEFIAALPGITIPEATVIAERLRHGTEQLRFEAIDRPVTCSVGVAVLPAGFTAERCSLDEVIAEADRALYRAKNAGRNRVETASIAGVVASA